MHRIATALAVVGLLLGLAAPSRAATVVRFTHTQLNFPSGTTVTDIASDEANRVWFTTTSGVVALSGTAVATGFPLYSALQGYTDLSSVAFGLVDAAPSAQENFFLGSNSDTAKAGLIYGRMLTEPSFGTNFELGPQLIDAGGATGWGNVNALASDGATTLWAATDEGVARISLPDLAITVFNGLRLSSSPVLRVLSADPAVSGGSVFFSTAREVYLAVVSGASATRLRFADLSAAMGSNGVGGIALDATGNLWVAEATALGTPRRLFFYPAPSLLAWAADPIGVSEPSPLVGLFNPGAAGSVYTSGRTITDLGVNPLTGEVWVATTMGAFFQETAPSGDLFGQKLCGLGADWSTPADDADATTTVCDDLNRGWHPMPQRNSETQQAGFGGESFGALLLDAAGNAWLGSDKAIRGVIARSMTLSGNRFIGVDARATITVTDDTQAGLTVPVSVKVGSETATLPVVLDASGAGRVSFGFIYGASDPTVPPYRFTVTKTSSGIPIEVSYDYTDAEGNTASLTATASWAEIVPFEDDLWIGGPCFLRFLAPR